MTTIAFDGKTLSAENSIRSGNYVPHNKQAKLKKLDNSIVFAMCGVLGGQRKIETILSSIPIAELTIDTVVDRLTPSILAGIGLIVCIDDEVYHLYIDEELDNKEINVTQELYPVAFGSGTEFAAGVLALGFPSKYAVLAAIACDTGSGGHIDTYDIASGVLYRIDPLDLYHPKIFHEMSPEFFEDFRPMRLDK